VKKLIFILGGGSLVFFIFFILIAPLCFTLMNNSILKNKDVTVRNTSLSQDVLQWKPAVEEYAFKNDMGDYVDLILAIIMQESSGKGLDVMQSSESTFNTRFPNVPNAITDPIYSIECGINTLKQCLILAGVRGMGDTENIKIALQGYNFGPEYIDYAKNNGGYSLKTAEDFSDMMAKVKAWNDYGDPLYVDHVFRYCAVLSNAYDYEKANEIYVGLMKEAIKQEGKKYLLGDTTFKDGIPVTFDCSGLTQWCFNSIGINIPRTAQEQYDFMDHIPMDEAIPGDLIFFKDTYQSKDYITHVGIYQGDMEIFHAGNPIGFEYINTEYWLDHLVCAGRLKEN